MEVTSWFFRPGTAVAPRVHRRAARPGQAPHRGQVATASIRLASPCLCPSRPPRAVESAIDILPPELAAVRRLLPPDFDLPLDVLAAMVLPTVPLANATLTAWSYLLDPVFLDDFYDRHRGRGYEDILTFPTVVALTRDALILHKGSALPALERADERGDMPTCQEAYYAKLRRIRPELSEAFLGEAAERLVDLLPPPFRAQALPASLDEFEVINLDGKQIKGVDKRLGPARGRPGKVIGGKVLVAHLPRTGLAVAMAAERDGEANDIRLMPRAVPIGPRPDRRAAAVGGRSPVLRPRPAGAAVRGGRPFPAPPLAEAELRRGPRPAGAGVDRSRGACGSSSSGAGSGR